MKLFSSVVVLRLGMTNITINPFIIAEDRNDAIYKIRDHIKNSPRLSQAQVKSIVVVEEAVIS